MTGPVSRQQAEGGDLRARRLSLGRSRTSSRPERTNTARWLPGDTRGARADKPTLAPPRAISLPSAIGAADVVSSAGQVDWRQVVTCERQVKGSRQDNDMLVADRVAALGEALRRRVDTRVTQEHEKRGKTTRVHAR